MYRTDHGYHHMKYFSFLLNDSTTNNIDKACGLHIVIKNYFCCEYVYGSKAAAKSSLQMETKINMSLSRGHFSTIETLVIHSRDNGLKLTSNLQCFLNMC